MKIIITRSTFIGGKLVEASPTPVEVPEADAKQLVSLGKAVAVKAADPAPVAAETLAPSVDSEPAPEKDEKSKSKGKS
jgi:hypothetical protein